MFKREMKVNFKNFATWLCILIGIFLVVYVIYPSLASDANMASLSEIMKIFPEEILKSFNMDISSIDTAFGWLKTEGFVFILLIIGCYAGILGSNILLKEESDKTIEYLNSLPVTRFSICLSKLLCGIIYIILITLFLGVFNYIGLSLSGYFDRQLFILLSITPIFSSIVIFTVMLFISTFTHKQKKMLGISMGFVFISYILNMLSTMSNHIEFLKYFSVFTLVDLRNVINTNSINIILVAISIVTAIFFSVLTIIHYQRKELV